MLNRNRLVFWSAATAVLLAVAAVLFATRDRPGIARAGDDPVAAVRDFLGDGVVDHNGYAACGYLTFAQQRAASARAGGGECRDAFDDSRLNLGGRAITTVHQVRRLRAQSTVSGNEAGVRLERGGSSIAFRLVKADFNEQEQFLAPSTEWRIASGGLSAIPPAPAGRHG